MVNIISNQITSLFEKTGILELWPHFSNVYVQSAIIFIFFFLFAFFGLFVFFKYLKRLGEKTKTKIDDLIIERTPKYLSLLIFFTGLRLAIAPLSIKDPFGTFLEKIISAIIILYITIIIIIVVEILINQWGKEWAKKTRSSIDDSIISLLHKTSKIIIWIFGIMYIMNLWNIDITSFLAGLGIAGIAIGFAVKDTLANIFGGISIILDRTYKSGDKIKIDSGEFGIVTDIGIRSTKIKTFDNELITIPNNVMANAKIQNYKQPNLMARCVVEFGVEYGSDINKVKSVVNAALKKVKNALKEPAPDVVFVEMADSALVFNARCWVEDESERYMTKEKIRGIIYDALNKAKISIPFPTRTVHLHKEK